MLMTEEKLDLRDHPIMVTLQDAIAGNGFLARITLSGRTLMRQEDGRWWMYGVQPAGIAASGSNVDEAFLRFRNRYKEILFDIAQESADFETFKSEVERFFYEPDADNHDERLWRKALAAIRNMNCKLPGPFSHLPRQAPESNPSTVKVERVDVKDRPFKPSENVVDTYSVAKAA